MPVFEYKCNNCGLRFDIFHKSYLSKEEIICPSCSGKEIKKLYSAFSSSAGKSTENYTVDCTNGDCSGSLTGCASGLCSLN